MFNDLPTMILLLALGECLRMLAIVSRYVDISQPDWFTYFVAQAPLEDVVKARGAAVMATTLFTLSVISHWLPGRW